MVASIKYVGLSGKVMDLTKAGSWNRSLAYAGLTGMVGAAEASVVTAVGVPGQTPTGFQTKEMTGQLTLLVFEGDGLTVDQLVAEIHREFSSSAYGQLMIKPRASSPWLSTPVRLNGAVEPPLSDLDGEKGIEIALQIISDSGIWTQETLSGAGAVTISNPGDAHLWPQLVITAAGSVKLPSGSTVQLPAPASPCVVSLDPYTSHEAYKATGALDPQYSTITRPLFLGEGIPEKQSRNFATTGGVTLQWSPQFRNPWR